MRTLQPVLRALKALYAEAAGAERQEAARGLTRATERLEASREKLGVTTDEYAARLPQAKMAREALPPPGERVPPPTPAKAQRALTMAKGEGLSLRTVGPIALAALVLVGAGYFIYSHFAPSRPDAVAHAAYTDILPLVAASRLGATFIGTVGLDWQDLSPAEKREKTRDLLRAVKSAELTAVSLVDTGGQVVAQAYGTSVYIFE